MATTIVVLSGLLAMAAVQAIFAVLFVSLFFRGPVAQVPDSALPKAAILLSLRGADAQLAETIQRLLRQDYARYELHVIVDSLEDPAWAVVEQAVANSQVTNVFVAPLAERGHTCGLQCSALSQAARQLDESIEIVITIDGDVVVHRQWLRELVAPFADDRVGATFGNRWFMPPTASWGSLVRYLWNAAAIVPMYVFSIPWGGTLAIRRKAFDDAELLEKWGKAIVHDAPVKPLLDEQRLRIRFVPSLMMPIREDCSLPFCLDFLKRQMTWTRLYHPHWWPVLLHAIVTTGLIAAAIVMVPCGLVMDRRIAYAAGGALLGYVLVMCVLLAMIAAGVRRTLRRRGEHTGWFSLLAIVKLPFAVLLAQVVYLVAVALATFNRQVVWRGVTYAIDGPWSIRKLDEQQFE